MAFGSRNFRATLLGLILAIFIFSAGSFPSVCAQNRDINEEVLAKRDADRMIEKLRDTTLLPALQEWRMSEMKFTDGRTNLAHWFFGLDTVFWVDGRHDAVSWNTGSKSRSTEQAVGVNQGAFASMRQGKLYTLGGTGIYKNHSNLFVFNVLKGWDLLKVKGLEPAAAHNRRIVNVSENEWWMLGNLVEQQDERGEVISPRTIWSLNLTDLEWSRVASMPEELAELLGDFQVYGTEGFALIFGVSTGGVLNLNTRQFVELPQYTLTRIPPHDAWGTAGHMLHWMTRDVAGNWRVERLDLKQEYVKSKPQPFFLPLHKNPSSAWMNYAMGGATLLLVLGAGGWFWLRSNRSTDVTQAPSAPSGPVVASPKEVDVGDDEDYELVEHLLAQPKRLMNAQEMNELLGIGSDVSDDSQRSRRARAIRRMNAAFQARHGQAFITRERDAQDRRHLLYKLGDVPRD